jgi:hypothetical protein
LPKSIVGFVSIVGGTVGPAVTVGCGCGCGTGRGRGDADLIGCGGGGFGIGMRSIFGGGSMSFRGKSIFALITTASRATWALMMNNMAWGLDGRSAMWRRPAA